MKSFFTVSLEFIFVVANKNKWGTTLYYNNSLVLLLYIFFCCLSWEKSENQEYPDIYFDLILIFTIHLQSDEWSHVVYCKSILPKFENLWNM